MVSFTAGLLEGHVQDWWVHLREGYWWVPDDINDLPQYRYPSWETFCNLVRERFHDPAIEEVHEKKMRELKMADDSAPLYFQKLERKAKLAGHRHDTGHCGTMVTAV